MWWKTNGQPMFVVENCGANKTLCLFGGSNTYYNNVFNFGAQSTRGSWAGRKQQKQYVQFSTGRVEF
jgi:hypothetical protein